MVLLKRTESRLSGTYRSDKRRCVRQGRRIEALDSLEELISSGNEIPADTHRPHKLRRNTQYFECHVTGPSDDWVLVYRHTATADYAITTFIATGSHSQVMASLRRYF